MNRSPGPVCAQRIARLRRLFLRPSGAEDVVRFQHTNSRFGITGLCAIAVAASLLATGCRYEPKPASILLFNGRGTSANDVAAVETILRDARLSYTTANSWQLGAMTPAQLGTYRLLI